MKMIDNFKKNIPLDKFFEDGMNFEIPRLSYVSSYPEFLKYFSDLKEITLHNLIIGVNFTYGWMPTIFDFRSDKFEDVIKILNDAKKGNIVSIKNLEVLKALINNSLVGTSKLLHFINPDRYAIWDSRVYRYLTKSKPNNTSIGNCETYLEDYLSFCNLLIKETEFKSLHEKIVEKVGYSMTALRVVELVMYSNGKVKINGDI